MPKNANIAEKFPKNAKNVKLEIKLIIKNTEKINQPFINLTFSKIQMRSIDTVMFQIKAAFWVTRNLKTGLNLENFWMTDFAIFSENRPLFGI